MREFVTYQREDGTWCAECRELPGYCAKGKTETEAIEKIKAALLLHYPCKCEE